MTDPQIPRTPPIKGLHQTILTLDAHLDAPIHFARENWSFGDRHEHEDDIAQLDLPRMADGNLTGGFFVIYTAQGALTSIGMNRTGMIVDASHASDRAFDQMLERSTTPIMLSHSGSRTMHDDPRNIDDARIRALARAGGTIGFATIYLSPLMIDAERAALFSSLGCINTLDTEEQTRLTTCWRALDRTEPMWNAGLDDYMRALFHVIEVAGVNRVSFGADFDGGGGIPGLENVSALPRITEQLQAERFSDDDIEKMRGGNLLRVLRAAESHASCGERRLSEL